MENCLSFSFKSLNHLVKMENCLSDHDQLKTPPHANHSSSQVKITNSENSDQALKIEKIVPKSNNGLYKMETGSRLSVFGAAIGVRSLGKRTQEHLLKCSSWKCLTNWRQEKLAAEVRASFCTCIIKAFLYFTMCSIWIVLVVQLLCQYFCQSPNAPVKYIHEPFFQVHSYWEWFLLYE